MIVRKFSKHFVQRWVEWCGELPSIEDVNRLIETGQQLRPQLRLCQWNRQELLPYLLLAEFWNDEAGVILRVDEALHQAVTLIWSGRRKTYRRLSDAT